MSPYARFETGYSSLAQQENSFVPTILFRGDSSCEKAIRKSDDETQILNA